MATTTSMMAEIAANNTNPYAWFNESYCFGNYVRCTTDNATIPTDEEAFGATETIWVITSCILIFQMQTGQVNGAIWVRSMVLYGSGQWCYMGQVNGAIWVRSMVLYGSGQWCYMGQVNGAIWVRSMVLYGSGQWCYLGQVNGAIWVRSMVLYGGGSTL